MKRRQVIVAPEAQFDLVDIESWLVEAGSGGIADAFIARILAFCARLELASERGNRHDDVRAGLRVVGFERRLTIAFSVLEDRVEVLRIFRAGRDWETELSDD